MADTRLGKIGITPKGAWVPDDSYEVLDMVLNAVENDGDGCSYVALKPSQNVTPGTDPNIWMKSTQAGQSIYDLAVKYHHFEGTEEEFEAEYQAALQAARDAAAGASAVEAQVEEAEASRVAAENARVSAEAERASAETARQTAETSRATAETARQSAESNRASAETTRQRAETARESAETTRQSNESTRESAELTRTQQFQALKTDMQTAIQNVDAKAAEIAEDIEGYEQNEAGRVSAEQGRVTAETARETAESARASAEQGRANAESARRTAEGARATAETARADAEGARATAEQGRVSAESNRVSAEQSRVAAETARESASATAVQNAEEATEAANTAAEAAGALQENLESGAVVPALAGDLAPWAGGSAPVEDTIYDVVRTAAGDKSIVSPAGVDVLRVVARSDFFAQSIRFSGKNLLRDAIAVGAGYYFLVPALPFGAYGTATQPNGLLFVDSDGNNLAPTVRVKKFSDGEPTSVNDGTVCDYTVSNGLHFYNPTEPSFVIVTGITLASTCARIAWSGNGFPYNKYIAFDDPDDAGFSFNSAAVIHAIHSFDLMLVIGSKADYFEFISKEQVKWNRVIDRAKPSWSNTDNGDGTYTHTATIAAMAQGGAVECGALNLDVDGNTISYTDDSATATGDYVKYELATVVSGVVSTPAHGALEDFGLEKATHVIGSAYITLRYVQAYEAAMRGLVDGKIGENGLVTSEALCNLDTRTSALESNPDKFGPIKAKSVDAKVFTKYGIPTELWGEGAPSASAVPSNWPEGKPWDGIPAFRGQIYNDTTNKKEYKAWGNSAISDWALR